VRDKGVPSCGLYRRNPFVQPKESLRAGFIEGFPARRSPFVQPKESLRAGFIEGVPSCGIKESLRAG
jgi:hypothetical protein